MKRLLIIFFISLGTLTIAVGQSKSDKIFKLIELVNGAASINEILNDVKPQLIQKLNIKFEGENALKKNEDYDKFLSTLFKKVSEDLVNEDLYQIFDNYYDEGELDTIIAFYSLPVGQKTLKVNAIIKADLTNALIKKHLLDIKTQMLEKYEVLE